MNPSAPFVRRARRRIRTEIALSLDGGVDFLVEDDWRSPLCDHPLSPRPRKPYGVGKQTWAHMASNSRAEERWVADMLPWLVAIQPQMVADEQRDHTLTLQRRVRAAANPLTVIEPKTSIPGVQRIIAELERRTHLPIEEIRATFRQGRRSEDQQATRALVEDAIIATYRHHRMLHPCLDPAQANRGLGTLQWQQAREVWREFVGQSKAAQRDRALCMQAFGEWEDSEGQVRPAEYGFEPEYDAHGNSIGRRAPRSQKRPQIAPRLAEAVEVDVRTIRRILEMSAARHERVGHNMSRQEAT